jgi:hypothetical protein
MRHHIQKFGSKVGCPQSVIKCLPGAPSPGVKVTSHLHLLEVKLSLCLFGSALRHEDVWMRERANPPIHNLGTV